MKRVFFEVTVQQPSGALATFRHPGRDTQLARVAGLIAYDPRAVIKSDAIARDPGVDYVTHVVHILASKDLPA